MSCKCCIYTEKKHGENFYEESLDDSVSLSISSTEGPITGEFLVIGSKPDSEGLTSRGVLWSRIESKGLTNTLIFLVRWTVKYWMGFLLHQKHCRAAFIGLNSEILFSNV